VNYLEREDILLINRMTIARHGGSFVSPLICSIPRQGESTNEILFHFTMALAAGELTLETGQKWFDQNIESSGVPE
jgi:hypothetical protein